MFCKNCGKQLADGAAFCNECGTQVTPPIVTPTPVQPAPAAAPEVQAQVPQNTTPEYFAQPEFEPKKKKSKKGLIIGLCSGAVALIVAAVLIFFFSPWFKDNETVSNIKGDYIKDHGTSDEYAQFVEDKTMGGYVDSASSAYGSILEVIGNYGNTSAASGVKMQLDIVASDDAIDLLEQYLKDNAGAEIELDWIDDISFAADYNVRNMVMQYGLQAMIGGQSIADIDMIYDLEKYEMYMAILNLSDKYVGGALEVDQDVITKNAKMTELLSGLAKALPTEEQFDALLSKYLDIIVKNIAETANSEETLEIGAISQKVTVVEYSLDTDTMATVLRAVLETAKEDEELAGYIRKVAEYLEEQEVITDADDVCVEFEEMISDGISKLKDLDSDNEKIITIVNYVDASHKVVGRVFKPADDTPISYVTLRDGDKFATLFEIPVDGYPIKLQGEGTTKSGVTNATFALNADGARMLDVEIVDCDTSKMEQGILSGAIRITPTSTLLKEMRIDATTATMISTAGFALELKLDATKTEFKYEINILSGSKVFAGIHMNMTMAELGEITKPSADKVIPMENVNEWAATFDFNKLVDALEKTTLPAEYVSMIKQMLTAQVMPEVPAA